MSCLWQLHLSDSSADADEESDKLEAAVLLLEEMVFLFCFLCVKYAGLCACRLCVCVCLLFPPVYSLSLCLPHTHTRTHNFKKFSPHIHTHTLSVCLCACLCVCLCVCVCVYNVCVCVCACIGGGRGAVRRVLQHGRVQEAAWEEEEQDEVEDMEEEVEHDDDDDQEEAAAETVEKGQGSSYGYLEAVARYSAHELLGITLPRRLAYSTSRHAGSDIRELVIRVRGKVASGAGGGGGGGWGRGEGVAVCCHVWIPEYSNARQLD